MNWSSFKQAVTTPLFDLPRTSLIYARNIAYPDLDVDHTLAQIDLFAQDAQKHIPQHAPVRDRAEAVSTYLFSKCGFRGNALNYSDPRNSFLNDVLERRLGIPITLSVFYIAVAKKLKIPAYGIGMPGHFIVGVETEVGALLLDPFHNGVWLSQQDCVALVRQTTGYRGEFQSYWLEKTPEKEILIRMLNNLRLVYSSLEQWELALKTIQHMRVVAPAVGELVRDEGLVNFQLGRLPQAAVLLEQYLEANPQAADAAVIKEKIGPQLSQWARLN